MSKMKFNADEMMVMAMFKQDTAENTKKELEAVLPYVVDDMAVRLLVEQVISKMENIKQAERARKDNAQVQQQERTRKN